MRKILERAARHFTRDDGAAGLVIAMIIAIVAATALTVFFRNYTGPARDLEKLKNTSNSETVVQAALFAYFNANNASPCPDTNFDGSAESTCTSTSTTSGTLPWITLGISKQDALDPYGNYFTYVVAGAEKNFCVAVGNDYDSGASPEYTGETNDFATLQVISTTAGATGIYVPYALISHGANRLGAVAGSTDQATASPTSTSETANATSNPTTIYTGPYSSDGSSYFDDSVWYPQTSELESVCAGKTVGEAVNASVAENFEGTGSQVDSSKFDTGTSPTPVVKENGQARFDDDDAYMTTASSNTLNTSEQPLYISAEWTPDSAATAAGFSIVTRAAASPGASYFDPGITFQFFSTGTAGSNTISILDNGAQVGTFTSADSTFTLTYGETYLLEVYDDGDEVWMKITQKSLTSNRASAYATGITQDTTGTRIAFVNGAAAVSRLDDVVIGRPMLAFDTNGTGYAETSGNQNGTTTGSVTIEAWVKARSLPTGSNTASLVSQWDTAGTAAATNNSSYRLFVSSGGALSLSVGDGAVNDTESLGVALTVDTWTHLAVSYDESVANGEVRVYVNGSLANTITGQTLSGANIRTASRHFVVGGNMNTNSAVTNVFDGLVSDVRVWSDVRTATEISAWYKHRLPVVDAADATLDNLVVNWKFDRESGGFTAVQVEPSPTTLGSDGDIQGGAIYVADLLNTYRLISTDICNGYRVGAYRCDFRDAVTGFTISGEDLLGMASIYAKVWGAGGGARINSGVLAHTGGGGGFAGILLLNTGGDLAVTVGTGGTAGQDANGVSGTDSTLSQSGSVRARGNGGTRGTNGADGAGGTGVASSNVNVLNSVTASGALAVPGCNPAGDPCTDRHYTTTGGPISNPGRGGDGSGASARDGKQGAVILLW